MISSVAKRVVVSGRVQGVGYRAACAGTARRLGVAGRVRNLDDGCVEVLVAGDRASVDQLVAWCRRGPHGARVTRVEVADWTAPPDLGASFVVTR